MFLHASEREHVNEHLCKHEHRAERHWGGAQRANTLRCAARSAEKAIERLLEKEHGIERGDMETEYTYN